MFKTNWGNISWNGLMIDFDHKVSSLLFQSSEKIFNWIIRKGPYSKGQFHKKKV